jgi:hypothetical protein
MCGFSSTGRVRRTWNLCQQLRGAQAVREVEGRGDGHRRVKLHSSPHELAAGNQTGLSIVNNAPCSMVQLPTFTAQRSTCRQTRDGQIAGCKMYACCSMYACMQPIMSAHRIS